MFQIDSVWIRLDESCLTWKFSKEWIRPFNLCSDWLKRKKTDPPLRAIRLKSQLGFSRVFFILKRQKYCFLKMNKFHVLLKIFCLINCIRVTSGINTSLYTNSTHEIITIRDVSGTVQIACDKQKLSNVCIDGSILTSFGCKFPGECDFVPIVFVWKYISVVLYGSSSTKQLCEKYKKIYQATNCIIPKHCDEKSNSKFQKSATT